MKKSEGESVELSTADRVERARKQAGLTQVELARAVGARPATISDMETGKQGLGSFVAGIARACDTTADFLLGLTDDPGRPAGLAARIEALPADRRAVVEQLVEWLEKDG